MAVHLSAQEPNAPLQHGSLLGLDSSCRTESPGIWQRLSRGAQQQDPRRHATAACLQGGASTCAGAGATTGRRCCRAGEIGKHEAERDGWHRRC
eukprot:CAMPEP_0115504272 /NCGR_PEP_ID=MMETSP0271-20121206/69926_1 /TAXON_ID=71861 /ORGANISM="Scrippsiella trochoidea, Strain CCMP3099" /LENGTH=93 /DNA_ID=CAMNT_0002933429 /DNA_START=289 /DNA_END=567 /DNA_ORIENTATION=+